MSARDTRRKTKKWLLVFLLVLYLVFFLTQTLLFRQAGKIRWNMQPFWELREALKGDQTRFQFIVVNIFLTVPLGYLVSALFAEFSRKSASGNLSENIKKTTLDSQGGNREIGKESSHGSQSEILNEISKESSRGSQSEIGKEISKESSRGSQSEILNEISKESACGSQGEILNEIASGKQVNCRKWPIILIIISFSVGTELLQLVTGRGLCEFDDMFNNSLGGLLGMACFFGPLWIYDAVSVNIVYGFALQASNALGGDIRKFLYATDASLEAWIRSMPIHAAVCIGLFCLAGLYSRPSILFCKTKSSAVSPTDPSAASPSDTSAASPTDPSAASPSDTSAASPSDTSATSPTDPSAASPSDTSAASPSDTSAASPSDTSAASPSDPSAASPRDINADITPPDIKDNTSDAGVRSKLWRSANYPALLLRLLPANAASVAVKALLDCLIFGLALPWYYYFTGFIVQSIMILFARFALNADTPELQKT